MSRYDDCVSCAFHHVEPAICEQCHKADQWEPADDDMAFMASGRKVMKFVKTKMREGRDAA